MKIRIIPILTLLLLPLSLPTSAQEHADSDGRMTPSRDPVPYSDFSQLTAEDYATIQLPPLHVLLENAKNSPQVQYYNSNKEEEERELRSIRRTWLKYIKLNANYSYGSTDIYNSAYIVDGQPVPALNTGREQSYWNVGVTFSMPLEELFDRRNKIKKQKTRIESIQYEIDRWYDDLSLKVIDAYTQVTENLAILQSAASSMVHARAQYAVSETDFVNGSIDAQMLSRQKSIENTAIREYEQTRAALNSALLRLEVLTSTRIINR